MVGNAKRARVFDWALWLLFAPIFALACSPSENLGTVPDNGIQLTFPFTISLSTPHPVSPTAPVLLGAVAVRLGSRSQIISGTTVAMGTSGLTAQPDAVMNEVWSRGTADLGDRDRIRGTLHAAKRRLGNSVSIEAWDRNPAFDPPNTLTWTITYPSTPSNNVSLNAGEKRSLQPGRYSSVSVSSQAVLTLTTGTYYLKSLTLQSQARVSLDQADGPVIIYVADGLTLRGSFASLSGAPPDLLLAFLGESAIVVESAFDGALIAPRSCEVTLRSVNTPHRGFFFAKSLTLDAGAKVQYRAPLSLVAAANPPGSACRDLLGGNVTDLALPSYCKTCLSYADTDRDDVEDCVDGCPSDRRKTAPGVCGCGLQDTDSDADGVPDCADQCPQDPNNTFPGDCGCVGPGSETAPLLPAGSACSDPACPQAAATCNGAGLCGNRSSCAPGPGCKLVSYSGRSYWFCPGPATQAAATQACRGKQMALVRIDSNAEARFLAQFATDLHWIGANALGSGSAWRWATPVTNNGDQFWSGGASGSQVNSLFSSWAAGSPAAQPCAVLRASDGNWLDVDCAQGLGFICESAPQLSDRPALPPPGMPAQPPQQQGACVDEAATLPGPDHQDVLVAQVTAAETEGVFTGSAALPTNPTDTCVDDIASNAIGDGTPGHGCSYTVVSPPERECFSDAECAGLASGALCRQVKDDPGCVTNEGTVCKGHARCVSLSCPTDDSTICEQVEVCNAGTEFEAGLDPDSNADPEPFDPATLFGGATPDLTPSPAYEDPGSGPDLGTGPDHPWCFLNVQKPLPDAGQARDKVARSGGNSGVKLSFNPDLVFTADVNPLALGETDLKLHASAQLTANIAVSHLFGTSRSVNADILKAKADMVAERCEIRNDDTTFEVFGHDFFDADPPWIFNTAALYPEQTAACNKAVGTYIRYANRAKKAFRDAQQLSSQYHRLKQGKARFNELCHQLLGLLPDATKVDFFPGGLDCPANEPAEITINRFIDYYQAPGFGQIEQFRQAASQLTAATAQLKEKLGLSRQYKISDFAREESNTLVSVPFTIGPIPMLLEVDVFYAYGVSGAFELGARFPFDPLNARVGARDEIAWVRAGVMPYANAGLSAFVGAGGGFRPLRASLGIEGGITLGDAKAPLFVGAGLGAEVTRDVRPPPLGIQPPVAQLLGAEPLLHIGIPTAFKFHVWYDYGLKLNVENILSGEINAKLRIKIAFFSRTWRKRLIKFKGFAFQQELISGKLGSDPRVGVSRQTVDRADATDSTTSTVDGVTPVGLAEPQTPLAVLQPLSLDPAPPSATPVETAVFDTSDVESVFYDNLCCAPSAARCALTGQRPSPGVAAECCPGTTCQPDPYNQGFCRAAVCREEAEACANDGECCSVPQFEVSCGDGECQRCGIPAVSPDEGAPCTDDGECCARDQQRVSCGPQGRCQTCGLTALNPNDGAVCVADGDCCSEPKSESTCNADTGRCQRCSLADAECKSSDDCCAGRGLFCGKGGTCQILIP